MASPISARLQELFEKHAGMVYRRCQRLLGGAADAEEATEEVFVRAMRGWAEFDHRSAESTWLYQITTHYGLDLLRQNARRRRWLQQQSVASEAPAEEASAADLLHLRRLLAEADEEQARAVVYVYFDDVTHEQAGAVLGISKRTVGNLIERFLAWAKKQSN